MDHLARNHLEAAPLCPVPIAHVAAIQSDHDRTAGRRCCWLFRGLGGVRLHDLRIPTKPPGYSERIPRTVLI